MTTVLVGLLLILSGSLIFILLKSFSALEAETMQEDVKRVTAALDDEINQLERGVKDWSAWDDSYAFIQGQRPEYIEENIYRDAFITIDVNFIAFLDLQGNIIFQRSIDLEKNGDLVENLTDLKSIIQYQLGRIPQQILSSGDKTWLQKGWVQADHRIMYFVAQPIVDSMRTQPIKGTLIMGRYFTPNRLQKLENQTQLNLFIHPLQQDIDLSPSLSNIQKHLIQSPSSNNYSSIFIQPINRQFIGGYQVVQDVQKQPLFLLQVKGDRSIYHQGELSLLMLLATSGIAVLLSIGLMIILLDRFVIDRLLDLIQTVIEIGKHTNLSPRLKLVGRDELSTLSQEINQMLEKLEEKEFELLKEKEKSETLLSNILPQSIVDQLKIDSKIIANNFTETTILFADIVGFTKLSSQLPPADLVELLNDIFSEFDRLTEKYHLEKIKTIGDAYMVVAGLPIPMANHAQVIAEYALEMQSVMGQFSDHLDQALQIRIGINSGAVVAGVIGLSKFAYDIWGDAVNLAARMESSGEAGKIQVTEYTYQLLRDTFELEMRGSIFVKGKGEMVTYWLLQRH